MDKSYNLPVERYKLISAEASNEQIQELLGLSYEVFTNTVLFVQNTRGRNVTDFLDQDDAGQKQLFSTLFNLNCYEHALELVKPDLKNAKEILETLRKQFDTTQLHLQNFQNTLQSLLETESQFAKSKQLSLTEIQNDLLFVTAQLKEPTDRGYVKEFEQLLETVTEQELEVQKIKEEEAVKRDLLTIQQTTFSNKTQDLRKKKSTTLPPIHSPTVPQSDFKVAKKKQGELGSEVVRIEQQKLSFQKRLEAAKLESGQAINYLIGLQWVQKDTERQREELKSTISTFVNCPTCFQPLATQTAKEAVVGDLQKRLLALKDIDLTTASKSATVKEALVKEVEKEAVDEGSIEKKKKELELVTGEVNQWNSYEKELVRYTTLVETQKVTKKQLEEEIAILESTLATGYEACQKLNAQFNQFVSARKQKEEALKQSQVKLDTLRTKVEMEILPLEQKKDTLSAAFTKALHEEFPQKRWLDETKQKLEGLNQDLGEIELQIAAVKTDAEVLENLYEAFGKEGIVAELFSEYIPNIQQLASDYLTELTNNELQIEFNSEKTLKKKVEGVRQTRAQFEISVLKKNGGSGYDLVSGSEQNKAALVTNWALADLAYQHSNVTCNYRGYDECMESLDAKSTERLVQMILNRSKDSGQITFVVTHRQELDDAFDNKIILSKEAGVSKIKEVT